MGVNARTRVPVYYEAFPLPSESAYTRYFLRSNLSVQQKNSLVLVTDSDDADEWVEKDF